MPVVSNYTATPARTADEVRAALRRQITGKVRWREAVAGWMAEPRVGVPFVGLLPPV